jgi:hypothetical protein
VRHSGFLVLAFIVGSACGDGNSVPPAGCAPSYLEVSSTPIQGKAGVWSISYRVVLIGCSESLRTLRPQELLALAEECREPADWSHLRVATNANDKRFRRTVVARLNHILHRPAISDVFFDLRMIEDYHD